MWVVGYLLLLVGCRPLAFVCLFDCCLVVYHFSWLVVVVYCLLFVGCRLLFAALVCRSVFICLFVGLSVD